MCRIAIRSLVAAILLVGLGAPPVRAQTCDDSDPCTINDSCGEDGTCHGTFQTGRSCNDSQDCTVNDRCQEVTQQQGMPGCEGDPAPVNTACGGGCGTCQERFAGRTTCIGDASNAGKPCDTGLGGCFPGSCTISGGFAFCVGQLKNCPVDSACKGGCNFETGQCDNSLSQCSGCERCDAGSRTCLPINTGGACDDFDVCTSESRCTVIEQVGRSFCMGGAPIGSSPTPTATSLAATATATVGVPPTPGPCVGDCNNNKIVAINELITGVNIALGSAPITQCSSFDTNGNSAVDINELIAGVNALLNGCI